MKKGMKKGLAVLGLSLCMTGALVGCNANTLMSNEDADKLISQTTEFLENQKGRETKRILDEKLLNCFAEIDNYKCFKVSNSIVQTKAGFDVTKANYVYKENREGNNIYQTLFNYDEKGDLIEGEYIENNFNEEDKTFSSIVYDLKNNTYYQSQDLEVVTGGWLNCLKTTLLQVMDTNASLNSETEIIIEELEENKQKFSYMYSVNVGEDSVVPAYLEITFQNDKVISFGTRQMLNGIEETRYMFEVEYDIDDYKVDVSEGFTEIDNPNV